MNTDDSMGVVVAAVAVALIVLLVALRAGAGGPRAVGCVSPGRGCADRRMTAPPMSDQVPVEEDEASRIREPSLLDALIPVVALIGLIALTIAIFGTDATGGPLQVALLSSALVAGIVAAKNGHSAARVRDAAIGGVSSALGAVFILLAVGALIGAWNMSGTIPTVVYYGVGLLTEEWFYPATLVVCGLVGLAIGSSWTTAATLGVAFVALAPLVGADPAIAAGAVISGAYFGDKMTPISETTVLVPSMVGGVTTQEHIGAMLWTSGPAIGLALLGFVIIGLLTPASGSAFDPTAVQDAPGRRVQHLVDQPPAALPARHPVAAPGAAVPVDLRQRGLRCRPGDLHPACRGRGVRG